MRGSLVLFAAVAIARAADERYAGSQACRACHAAIHVRQDASHHAQSLRPPSEITELRSAKPLGELAFSRGADGGVRLSSGPASMPLEWAFGSGAKGITPAGRSEDGKIRESRLSWYKASGQAALTPGATKATQQSALDALGRALSEKEIKECFGCHTTGYQPDQPAPSRAEMGVRCESCHGPGKEHISAMSGASKPADRKIVNPGRLDAASQVRLCGNCHGKVPADTDLAAIRAIESNPNTARFPSTRLVLSRCFNESTEGLKCSRCHDPHGDTVEERSRFDTSCVSCHKCPKASRDCASCHMPKERVMVQSEFTDHWIRVVREKRR